MTPIEPATIAGLVAREVRSGSRDGTPTRIVVARRTYATDRDDLWDALTDAERIPRWFLPVTGDLAVGGHYQVEGNAGGTVQRCAAPESFAVTWEMGPMLSWLSVTLDPAPEGTTLELVHEAPVDPDLWEQFGPSAVGLGWDLALLGLGMHLDTGDAVDPEVATGLLTTPEGVALAHEASSRWAEAAVADGDDPEAAHAAARRTVAAYTGQPEDTQHEGGHADGDVIGA